MVKTLSDATSETDQADWAQFEGKRDTTMVSYTGSWSSNCTGQNTRFGCGSVAVHLKVASSRSRMSI